MANVVGKLSELTSTKKRIEWNIPNYSDIVGGFSMSSPFTFVNSSLYLRVYRPINSGWLSVSLAHRSGSPCNVTFSMKISYGTLAWTKTEMCFLTCKSTCAFSNFCEVIDLIKQEDDLLPSDTLTIICDLVLDGKQPTAKDANSLKENAAVETSKQLRLTDLNLLSENLKGLYTGGEFCDVTLHVKNKEFKAHKIILAMRSPVFASYFKHETAEKQTGIINIPDCDPDSFKDFLEYLYSGKLENMSLRRVPHLYRTANKYDVQALKMFCVEYIKLNFNVEYFCDVVVLAEIYNDANLLAAAQNFFNRNLGEIFETAKWKDLMKNYNNLANSLLTQMSKHVQVVEKRPRFDVPENYINNFLEE